MNYAVRLDYPPSVNTYYRSGRNGVYLSAKGREFKAAVAADVTKALPGVPPLKGRIGVQIELASPNVRSDIDIDNRIKATLDALQGYLFDDDRQVDQLIVRRLPIAPPGYADVIVSEL